MVTTDVCIFQYQHFLKRASPFVIDDNKINLVLGSSVMRCSGELADVPVREEGSADDEVILFTEVNYSFSIVCGHLSHAFQLLFLCFCCCILHLHHGLQARARRRVVERHQLSSAVSSGNHPCPLHLRFQWGRRQR